MNETEQPYKRDWGKGCTLLFVAILLFAPKRSLYGRRPHSLAYDRLRLRRHVRYIVPHDGHRCEEMGERHLWRSARSSSRSASGRALSKFSTVMFAGGAIDGIALLETALSIWVSNVAIFATLYHAIGEREFLFPHRDGDPPPRLVFLDFLFLSFTTATAFSPTDTAPLSTRTRMLIMVESAISLMMLALAAARAVNILT